MAILVSYIFQFKVTNRLPADLLYDQVLGDDGAETPGEGLQEDNGLQAEQGHDVPRPLDPWSPALLHLVIPASDAARCHNACGFNSRIMLSSLKKSYLHKILHR